MESIKSYLAIIEPNLLTHLSGKSNLFIKAFQGNNFVSEEAFIAYICGEKHNRRYYFSLKDRVIKTLQVLAIISDSYGEKTVKKKLDFCRKNFVIGKKFLAKGERSEGIRVIKQAYDIATSYEYTHLACEICSILHHDHIYYNRNLRKADFYAAEMHRYLRDYTAEKNAEIYYYRIVDKMNGSLKAIDFDLAIEGMDKYKGESLRYHTFKLKTCVHREQAKGAYEEVINICRNALSIFQKKNGVFSSQYHFFLMSISIAQIALKQYKAAYDTLLKAEEYAPARSFNDYLVQLYRTVNALHAGNYELAYKIYIQNRNCRFEVIKQQFAIIEAYLSFLFHMGHLNAVKRFRMGKYLNETFKAETENQGNNINVFIAELLVYLSKDRGKFIDRIEAIENYSYRHLRGKDTARAKRFIKILCMLPSAHFHPVALQRKAVAHIQFLKNNPIRTGQNISIEIIPFEVLLEMILQKLARKVA